MALGLLTGVPAVLGAYVHCNRNRPGHMNATCEPTGLPTVVRLEPVAVPLRSAVDVQHPSSSKDIAGFG